MAEVQLTEDVEYRDIPDWPGYRVGSDGSVWSLLVRRGQGMGHGTRTVIGNRWRRLKTATCPLGYKRLLMCPGKKLRQVHRLVLEAFVGPCPGGMECCHNDGNPSNNALSNLRWDTPKGNAADRPKHGTHHRGERHPMAQLTEDDVRSLRADYVTLRRGRGKLPNGAGVSLMAKYGIAQVTLNAIVRGELWAHVT